jgi:predicted SnoaL-like aldol condensation-catalyzing enzyme
MRHSTLLVVTASALVSTAIALIAASVFLQPTPVAGSSAGSLDRTNVVRQFYAAVNDGIATGDVTAVHRVVAPHFVEQDPLPGVRSGREGLEDYLRVLHTIDPAMRLVVNAVVASDDQVVARVTVQPGREEGVLEGAVIDDHALWGPVDSFRVAGGAVVERWGHSEQLVLAQSLADVSLDFPTPVPRVVMIARVAIDQGSRWNSHEAGPRLLFLEEGGLQVTVSASEPPRTSTTVEFGTVGHQDHVSIVSSGASLAAGESWVAPAGADIEVANLRAATAQLLVVTFAVPDVPGGAASGADAPPTDAGTILAGGLATDVGVGQATLTLGQLTLARHAQLSLSSAAGPILIAVDAGRLDVSAWGMTWGRGWVRRGTDGMSIAVDEAAVGEGDGLLLHPGGTITLRNGGGKPAVVLVLTLRSGPASPPVGRATFPP